ncbi:MAG: hypothetical protein AAGF27_00555 [Pseudomonadota bacterium]
MLGIVKKFLQMTCTVFIVLALVLALPRAYERLIPTNNSAALALAEEVPENIGNLVVECLNEHNHLGVWWDWLPADSLKAHQDRGGSWSSSHYVISGRSGWSVTWAAIIPLATEPLTAYETFGAKNNPDGAFHRTKLPIRVLGTLKRCGVLFGGVYPDALPIDK